MTPRTKDILTMGKSKKYYSLSWEDAKLMVNIADTFTECEMRALGGEGYYKEVLSRFLFRKHLMSNGWVNKGGILVRYSNPRLGLKADGTLIIGYNEYPTKIYTLEQLNDAIK